jgi:APA family basic amino acid/polyamine antiporter
LKTSARTVSLLTATCIVIADMIGTGVFTSLGFQVGDLPSGFAILALWAVGGVCALCGALCYGELAATLPRSGGEYHFLGTIYHPAAGFLAGWISATVGFAAPVALAAMAFGKYLAPLLPGPSALLLSLAVLWAPTALLLAGARIGSAFLNAATLLKVALILAIIGAAFLATHAQPVTFLPAAGDARLIASAPFAVSLVYVMYAYSGWNGSVYIVGEIREPGRNLPLSLGLGTLVVTVLYLALNAAFLRSTPAAELAGKVEIGLIAGGHIFGADGARVMALLIGTGLVSAIAAMMWTGPRVTMTMGEDWRALRWLAHRNGHGTPTRAIVVQAAIATALLLTASFEKVLTYVQLSLVCCSFATVLGVIVLRRTQPDLPRPYRAWGYPLTPLVFLAISAWMMIHVVRSNPVESLAGLATMALGLLVYFLSPRGPDGEMPHAKFQIPNKFR